MPSAFDYTQQRIQHTDGSYSDVTHLHCPPDALAFRDLPPAPAALRLRDVARLRWYKARIRGEIAPQIVAWACLETDQPARRLFPTLNTTSEQGEHFLSANSFITYVLRGLVRQGWLRWEAGAWGTVIPPGYTDWQARAAVILHWLQAEGRLWLESGPDTPPPARSDLAGCDPLLHVVAVGRGGSLRDTVRAEMPTAAFNTSFFLFEHDDYASPHSALGDPYGLLVSDGVIVRPPLYPRSAIWRGADGRWRIDRFAPGDLVLRLPGGVTISSGGPGPQFALNPPTDAPIALYTRAAGLDAGGPPLEATPRRAGRLEVVIVDRAVMSWERGGGLFIPQNGFVLSFTAAGPDGGPLTALGDLAPNIDALRGLLTGGAITYDFAQPAHRGMTQAMQCGPRLLQDGQITITGSTFVEEAFWNARMLDDRYHFGIVPTEFPLDADTVRAARIGIGVDAEGGLVVVAVSGASRGIARPGIDSVGATLHELAGYLAEAGAVEAVNLDGGGSTQIFVDGGLTTTPGDRRGRPGVAYERLIPVAGIISNSP